MTDHDTDILASLACEIDKRPRGAATAMELMGSVRSHHRAPGALVIEFDPAAAARVDEFVAAESLCCAKIGWLLEQTPRTRLTITATPEQLDALAGLFERAPVA